MTTNEEAFFVLRTGVLAYLDTFAGLVPCKVVACPSDSSVSVRLTATRGAYKKGETLTNQQPGFNVVPRTAVFVRGGQFRIAGNPVRVLADGQDAIR